MTTIDFDATYSVDIYPGIAFYLRGYYEYPDEDYIWSGVLNTDESRVRAVMVGDDREHILDIDQITKIDERDYCPECGQIGCTVGWRN